MHDNTVQVIVGDNDHLNGGSLDVVGSNNPWAEEIQADSSFESHNRTWEQLSDNFMAQVTRLAQLDVEDKARGRRTQSRRRRRKEHLDRRTKARSDQQELRKQLLSNAGYGPDADIDIEKQVEPRLPANMGFLEWLALPCPMHSPAILSSSNACAVCICFLLMRGSLLFSAL